MNLRADLALISEWIQPQSRILDLGCGDGTLLRHLRDTINVSGYGIEIEHTDIVKCIESDINVIQTDLDEGINNFFDADSFDYVVMTQALQAINTPRNYWMKFCGSAVMPLLPSPIWVTGQTVYNLVWADTCRSLKACLTTGITPPIFTSAL